MSTLFLLEISKQSRWNGQWFPGFSHEVGDSREALEAFVKEKYKVELDYDERLEFPYFSDGGFKYIAQSEFWTYTFFCYPTKLIKKSQLNPLTPK